jgi:hypothetical protein
MSLELVNTLGTLGTFLVIAATAIAAIVQLRHARSSNHIAALNELRETQETPDFQAAYRFVLAQLAAKLQDPAFRYRLVVSATTPDEISPLITMLLTVGNYYESIGVLVKAGLVERELVMQMFTAQIGMAWKKMAPATAIYRRSGGLSVYENFEYLAVLAQDWLAAHPNGTYPRGLRRLEVKDEWLEADKQYAASLAPG